MNYYFVPVLLCLAATAMAQPSQVMEFLPPSVAERGPHHRVIEQVLRYQTLSGQIAERKGTYTEIGTGLQFWNGDRWSDSDISIDVFEGYAAALRGQIKAVFLANINSSGAIELTFEGRRYASHLVALLYTDAMSGQSVVVAQIKDSIGEVQPEGKVLYRDAFGGCKIDVLYTYSLAGVEQDLLIREQLPDPWLFGIDPQFARIEAVTEFLNSPEPQVTAVVWKRNAPPEVRAAMAEPDLVDETLRFGTLEIGSGGAFPQEEGQPKGLFNDVTIPISKRWIASGQRRFLFEIVDWPAVEPELRKLPQAAAAPKPRAWDPVRRLASRELLAGSLGRPVERQARADTMRMASAKSFSAGKSLVWDYAISISQTNATFKGDTTYFVRSDVQLSQTTRIEGGAVFKFTNSTAAASRLLFKGPVVCLTSPYNPAIFTSMSDCTVGEIISTNAISGYYGTRLLDFSASGQDFFLHDLKLRYGLKGLVMSAGTSLSATNIQIIECSTGLEANGSYTVNFFNGLMAGLGNALSINSSPTVRGEHITFHNLTNFRSSDSSATPCLTNCLIIAGGSRVAFNGENVQTSLSDAGVFQTVGAGSHYLSEFSQYRDAGTTNLNPSLALAMRGLSTHPPSVLTNAITLDTVLGPQAPRDTDTPDLGWHYPVCDFAAGHVTVTNATVLLTNGVVVATFGPDGFTLYDNASLISQGTALAPNILTRYYSIQEQAVLWGGSAPVITFYPQNLSGSPPSARLRFTHSFVAAGGGQHTATAYPDASNKHQFGQLEIKDGVLSGGTLTLGDTNTAVYGFTNNLLERVYWNVEGDSQLSFFNNLIRGGDGFFLQSPTNSPWIFKDNLVDSSALANVTETLIHGYNAYFASAFCDYFPTHASELVLTNLAYETGALSLYYQPTNTVLANAGSRNSTNAALAHFTIMINQAPETNSVVDIGAHLVALDPNTGLPLDLDADGIPDYLEDSNGNESTEGVETDWKTYASINGLGASPALQVFTPLE